MASQSNITSDMAKLTMIQECLSSSNAPNEAKTLADGDAAAFKRHAAVLNNVGSILFQRDNAFDSMRVFRESVQTLIQAVNNNGECRLSKKRQEEMKDYLNYLLKSKDHLETVSQLESAKKCPVVDDELITVRSTDFAPPVAHTYAKNIPGLFQSTSRSKFAKYSENPCAFVLSFAEPFTVQLTGKSASNGNEEHPSRQKPRMDACEVPMCHVSEATMFNMGLVHAQWGSMESALQYFQLAISVSSSLSQDVATPGLRNPIVLASLSNIGQIFCQSGRIEEAVGFFSDALARGQAELILLQGETKPPASDSKRCDPAIESLRRTLARIMVNMANAQFCFCAYDEARRSCENALKLLRGHAANGLDGAAVWFNMGLIHEHQQKRLQALQYYHKFLHLACRLVGPNHACVADVLLRAGTVYFDMGRLDKAMPPLLAALGIRAKSEKDENHFSMAEIYHQIGKVLLASEAFDDAMRALSKALEIQTKSSQERIPGCWSFEECLELSETLLNIGRLHHARGDFGASLAAYREVLALSVRIFGKNHRQTARLRVIVANLELELGQVSRSMLNFEEAARIESEHGQSLERTTVKVKNPLVRVKFSHHHCAPSA